MIMNNYSRKQILDKIKIDIFTNNIKIIFIIIGSGILLYLVESLFFKILLVILALSMFFNEYEELKYNINSYNDIIDKKSLDINKKVINKEKEITNIHVEPIKSKGITQNQSKSYSIEEYGDEEQYCEICGRLLTQEEYEDYDLYCEDCYTDINVDYQINGLTDYNKPYIDAIDDYSVYDHLYDKDDFGDDLMLNDIIYDDGFDEF